MLPEAAKATIAMFETGNRKPYKRTLAALQAALEARGVQFTPDGVRAHACYQGTRPTNQRARAYSHLSPDFHNTR